MPTLADRRANAIRTRNRPAAPGAPFQSELEKGEAGGYASLDETTALIPASELGTGTPSGSKALLGDRTWGDIATPADVAAEATLRTAADNAEAAARVAAVSAEATMRAANDTTLQSNITAEAASRLAGDALALLKASNLSDLASAATARTNLGLGTVATMAAPDYGNWTATDASGAGLVFANGNGKYIAFGKLVIAWAEVTYPVTADGSAAKIGGLPFVGATGNPNRAGGFIGVSDEATAIRILVTPTTQTVSPQTAAGAAVTNAALSSNEFWFTVIYLVP